MSNTNSQASDQSQTDTVQTLAELYGVSPKEATDYLDQHWHDEFCQVLDKAGCLPDTEQEYLAAVEVATSQPLLKFAQLKQQQIDMDKSASSPHLNAFNSVFGQQPAVRNVVDSDAELYNKVAQYVAQDPNLITASVVANEASMPN